jgi:hypothetical protein
MSRHHRTRYGTLGAPPEPFVSAGEALRRATPEFPWRADSEGHWTLDERGEIVVLEGRIRGIYCPPPIEWPPEADADGMTTAVSLSAAFLACAVIWTGAGVGLIALATAIAGTVS